MYLLLLVMSLFHEANAGCSAGGHMDTVSSWNDRRLQDQSPNHRVDTRSMSMHHDISLDRRIQKFDAHVQNLARELPKPFERMDHMKVMRRVYAIVDAMKADPLKYNETVEFEESETALHPEELQRVYEEFTARCRAMVVIIENMLAQREVFKTKKERTIDSLPKHIRMETDEAEECQVCLQKYKVDETMKTCPCGHQYHAECIDEWLRKGKLDCPLCRSTVQSNCIINHQPMVK
ncbi:hypothetical protein SeLEV6574_g07512 [Synchytrium endobioticum]|uniref:RING-type domain-containing protein n=1 Tax=Synchytrium endobioticum TaxID=286115 RepID=A0A507CKU7_9FUNG|nr:hypothetical protein SeLEV6574_g07512 [Synchytrium endobioticum]